MIDVRAPMPEDEAVWRELWAGYCIFYAATVPETVTAALWARLFDPNSGIFARLATVDGAVVGFAHVVIHPGTWSIASSAYLEDLIVAPAARGHGVGNALITDLITMGQKEGWATLYWHTRADNATARRLYDRHTTADDFVRYVVPLE